MIRLSSVATVVVCLLAFSIAAAKTASSQTTTSTVPRLITFSGTLNAAQAESGDGVVVSPATTPTHVVAITFSLYAEQTGGAPLWSEVQNVHVDGSGRYTVQLGASQPDGLPMDIFTSAQAQWLGVQPQGQAEQARVMVVSVPYALKAADAETFGGLPPSAYALTPSAGANLAAGTTSGTVGNGGKGTNKPVAFPIYGEGNPGYIPLWTTASTLGASSFYQSATGIGLGTTTPQVTLDVRSVSNVAINGSTESSGNWGITAANLANTGNFGGLIGGSYSPTGIGVFGKNYATTGAAVGLGGTSGSPQGYGVQGNATSETGTAVGVGGISLAATGYGVYGTATNPGAFGVFGTNTAGTGNAVGVEGYSGTSANGVGVLGIAGASTGSTVGVQGENSSASGVGVFGSATSGSGVTNGVAGLTASNTDNASGVYGSASAASGKTYGVQGQSASSNGRGVYGLASSTTGTVYGVQGQSASNSGIGVYGNATSASGTTYGVTGQSASSSGVGVYGWASSASGNDSGILGQTDSSSNNDNASGVFGVATALSGMTFGVVGATDSTSTNASGVYGNTGMSVSGSTNGVFGQTNSNNGTGVYGEATSGDTTGTAYGVYGSSITGPGVYGISTGSNGVVGVADSSGAYSTQAVAAMNLTDTGPSNGLYAQTASAAGVAGFFDNTAGGKILYGRVNGGPDLFHVDGTGSGFFAGNLQVNGTLSKNGGMFKIDDPLDPANKYLSHSFVESPDMMNIYNGIVRLDARGQAWIELPRYFEALNRDFRYQLTSVGAPQPRLFIAREVSGNRFKIAGGKPNAKVSWQVTGIRQDAWANAHRIPNEEDKPMDERGTYMHPELYGVSAEKKTNARLQR